jgi:hypothetical protein
MAFRQLVTIKTTTQSNDHFADHCKFDKLLKQIMVMVFLTFSFATVFGELITLHVATSALCNRVGCRSCITHQ